MKQSLLVSLLLLLLSSSSLVAPIHARNQKSPSPVATPAPGPSNSDCSSVIYDMMDCLSYLTPGSNDTKPTKACCVGINSVLTYNPKCICVGLASSKDMGIALNNSRALDMPTICKIPIAAPHCGIMNPGASTPGASTPLSPSARTPKTSPSSPSSAESPSSSPSLAESPATTAQSPSSSGTNNLSVSTLTIVAVIVSSITYISAFSS